MSALFLKYRPQTFTDLVGQTSVVRTLQNALKTERPAHAYLFSGSRGTGKTSTARIFAKGLICQNAQEGNPCGECAFCTEIASGNLVDVIEIDAASNRGIDEIRELREKIQFAPNRATRKVYIIDEVHMLTKEAFNALLKTLEEPPDHAFFLLATTEMHKLPETIISRCQTFIFSRFTLDQLIERLADISKTENIQVDKESLELIARKAEGGLRDAISLLEQISAETESTITAQSVRESLGISSSETLENFWNALQEKDAPSALAVLKNISVSGRDFRTFGHDMLGFLREKLHASVDDSESLANLLPAIEEIEQALSRLRTSPIVNLPLEIAVFNLCKDTTKRTPSVLPKAVASTPSPTPPSSPSPAPTSPAPLKKEAENKTDTGFVFEEQNSSRQHKNIESPTPSTKETPAIQVSLDTIISKMTEIAEKAGIPSFAKKSFLTTQPEFVGEKLIFRASSMFHLEKIKTETIRNSVQNAIISIFGQKILIEFDRTNGKHKSETVATADDFLNF